MTLSLDAVLHGLHTVGPQQPWLMPTRAAPLLPAFSYFFLRLVWEKADCVFSFQNKLSHSIRPNTYRALCDMNIKPDQLTAVRGIVTACDERLHSVRVDRSTGYGKVNKSPELWLRDQSRMRVLCSLPVRYARGMSICGRLSPIDPCSCA